jgi:outer membrane cobalamin receptor
VNALIGPGNFCQKNKLHDKSKISFLFFFLLFSSIINQNIFPQNYDSIKTYLLDEAVVTGTRFKLNKSKLPMSISVINLHTVDEIHELNILPLINDYVPGLFLNNRNILGYGVGPLSTGQISMRGIGESPNSGVLILVDGQPQFMGIFGHPINDSYLKTNIERVEVIRGPASLLYGSNAFGGAINFITRSPLAEGWYLNSSLAYGSFNTSIASGSAGYKTNDFSFITSLSDSRTDGHRKDADDNFRSSSVYSKISYSINQNYYLGFDGNITDSKFYEPGPETSPKGNQFYYYLRGRGALSFKNDFKVTEGAVKLYYNYGNHSFYDGWHSNDNMRGLTAYQSIKFYNENILTAGFEYKNFGGKGRNDNLPPFAARGLNQNLSIDETEAYGILQLTFFNNFNFSSGLRFTNNSAYGSEYTPQFGFSYVLDEETVIKGNAGKAFRSPTIADLFLFPVANGNLEPERLWTYEVGISRLFIDQMVKGELTFFYLDAKNIIQQVPVGQGMQKVNTGSFNNKGIELMISMLKQNSLSAQLNYSYIHTSVKLPYAPEHKINFHLEYNFNIFTAASDVQGIYNLYTSGALTKQNYTLLSLSIDAAIAEWLGLFIKGDNLTDKKYYIDEGYPAVGTTLLAGIKLNY